MRSACSGRRLADMRVVVNGAGAAGTAIARLLQCVSYDPEVCVPVKDIVVCDSKGAIHDGRDNLTPQKQALLQYTNREHRRGSLQDVLEGADVFIGVSKGNLIRGDRMFASEGEKATFIELSVFRVSRTNL